MSGGTLALGMGEQLCFDAAAGTHPGWKFRENQDAVMLGGQVWQRPVIRTCNDRKHLMAGVADGVAFAPCAAQASRIVLQLLVRIVQANGGIDPSAVRQVQREMATKAAGSSCVGMAATLAALQLTPAGARLVSVGDSRIYRLREGRLEQLTVDHTLGRRLIASGEMTVEQVKRAGSLYEDLESSLVASESETRFEIHHTACDLRAGDVWLCCTDGITGAIADADLAAMLVIPGLPGATVRAILEAARSDRAMDDNLSAIVIRVRSRGAEAS